MRTSRVPIVGRTTRLLALFCSVAIAGAVAGCGGGSEPSAPTAATTAAAVVVVTPSSQSLAVGATLPLQAQVQDAAGQLVRDATVFWSSSDTTVATVSSAGVVSAKAVGTVQIAASAGGKSAVATLAVLPIPVASVSVLPANGTIAAGATLALSAVTYDAAGVVLPGRQVLWATSAPQIATVDASGNVRGVAGGTATITATSEGKSGASTLTVTVPPPPVPVASVTIVPSAVSVAIGQTTTLTAVTRDADQNTLAGRAVVWSSANSAVATVDGSGVVKAVGNGSAAVTATSEGKTGTAQVIVVSAVVSPPPTPAPLPVESVAVNPASGTLTVGGTLALSATTRDGSGNTLSGRAVAWSSSASQTATVSSSGLVTAVAAGNATITATSEGKTGSAVITVQAPAPAPVATVVITPAYTTMARNSTLTLTAVLKDGNGNVLTGRTIVWTVDDSSVSKIESTGSSTAKLTSFNKKQPILATATSEGQHANSLIVVQ
ncbi:MAG: Ig-like domain-containing protein [Gemmatimonadaceae bacterium]